MKFKYLCGIMGEEPSTNGRTKNTFDGREDHSTSEKITRRPRRSLGLHECTNEEVGYGCFVGMRYVLG